MLQLVGSSILLYLIDDARSNKNHVKTHITSLYNFITQTVIALSLVATKAKIRKILKKTWQAVNVCHNIKACLHNHHCSGRGGGGGGSIEYSECLSVVLVIQHVERTRSIILSSVVWPAVQLFSPHYLIKDTIFRKDNYWTQNTCFAFLCNFFFFATSLVLREFIQILSHMYTRLHEQKPIYLSNFN